MIKDFVPVFLGANHQPREKWIEYNTSLSKQLFDLNENQLCLIADGTYLYCQKSSNNKIQQILHSVQKGRALIEPFIVSTTNGYIVDAYGPFSAKDHYCVYHFGACLNFQ